MSDAPQAPVPTPATTSSGLAPNVAGALAYLLGPLTGLFFLVTEKENRFVRFHAAQSITVGVGLIILAIALSVLESLLSVVPILGILIGLLISIVLGLGSFVLWLVLMYRAYQGQEWEVPIAGVQARRLVAPPPPAVP
ncbi:MAG TPA: DUF4870 domain-containing protein [Gemmatimonadaceae bacterium]